MRHPRVYGIAALGLVGVAAAVAFAQSTVIAVPDPAPVQTTPLDASAVADLAKAQWGDAKRGQTLAGTCAACHGLDGNPPIATGVDPQYPRLAGQSERYVAHQLALFKAGERNTGMAAIMQPYAMPLSAQDMRDLGAWFSTQAAGAGVADDSAIATGPSKGMKFYQVGERLFRQGDGSRGIPACMACHGPAGAGNPGPPYPQVAGQNAAYATRRLQEYRAGTTTLREPGQFNVMAQVARQLTDDEINSLASYLQGLHDRTLQAGATSAPQAAPAAH